MQSRKQPMPDYASVKGQDNKELESKHVFSKGDNGELLLHKRHVQKKYKMTVQIL